MTWTLLEYVAEDGSLPFRTWFDGLNAQAAAKVTTALYRLEQGYRSNVRSVGAGVFEYRIDSGPGYRIYFARAGEELILLLGGGIKKGQHRDIHTAHLRWSQFKQRKKRSGN
ncbi:MAG: type II toxin-antitoxin system RelE/ParE family toxin [Gammaproteobacteria bacterium]